MGTADRAREWLSVNLAPCVTGSDSGLGVATGAVTPSAEAPVPMAADAALLAGPPPPQAAAAPAPPAAPLLQQTGPVFYPTPQMDGSIPLEQLKQRLQHQLEYYFSRYGTQPLLSLASA